MHIITTQNLNCGELTVYTKDEYPEKYIVSNVGPVWATLDRLETVEELLLTVGQDMTIIDKDLILAVKD